MLRDASDAARDSGDPSGTLPKIINKVRTS